MWSTCLFLFVYLLLLTSFPVEQVKYRFPVTEVDSCPTTSQSWYEAGIQLNCTYDESNKFQYLCIPNKVKTTLLQFCYDRIMGLYEKGHCLLLSDSGILDQVNCSMFNEGCPDNHYFSSDIFQYRRCLLINKEYGCFQDDPNCPSQNQTETTEETQFPSSLEIAVVTSAVLVLGITLSIMISNCLRWRRSRQDTPFKEERRSHVDICQRMNNVYFKSEMDVIWEKDGREIPNDDRNGADEMLILKNVNEEGRGRYRGIGLLSGFEKCSFELEIETLNMEGPVDTFFKDGKNKEKIEISNASPQGIYSNFMCCLRPSIHQVAFTEEKQGGITIWTTRENKDKPCNVFVTKFQNTSSSTLSQNIFTKDEEKKLLFHVALLLSETRSLRLNTKDTDLDRLFNEAKHFLPDCLEFKIDQGYFLEIVQWIDSIRISQDTATFVSDEVEMLTLWTLLQNCHVPRDVVEYIFDRGLTNLCMTYFRLQGYKPHESEPCIYLPHSFEDRFLEHLILKLDNEKFDDEKSDDKKLDDDKKIRSITDIEGDFDQRSSSIFECIIYYCFIIDKGSKDLISKYFRTPSHVKKTNEISICVPKDVTTNLIKRLGIDILVHPTICDANCHQAVSEICRIPEEILKWDLEARQRFLENFERGNVPVYRARCFIVGCAGAGKTTLLRNLKRKGNISSRSSPETTKGLDVHENLFIIAPAKDDKKETLYDYEESIMSNLGCFGKYTKNQPDDDPYLLSVMDFAGQVAYYACHQVYFSRRAIYLLVVDMAKDLKAEMEDNERHSVKGSLFEHWSHQDYFIFWIQTIRTYSEDDKKTFSSPVIVIATHKDAIKTACQRDKTDHHDDFHEQLMRGIPETIKDFFNHGSHRYYELELPPKKKTKKQLQGIEEVRQSIAESVTSLPQWGELIPATWLQFEKIIQEAKTRKIIPRDDLIKLHVKEDDLDDMLRFYHEIGIILFFPDRHLRNTIIVDIQWFVDSFKHIITDETHVSKTFSLKPQWQHFNRTGILPESLLVDLWKQHGTETHISFKDQIIPYMEKLGIVAKLELSEHRKEPHYYIPSINKIDLTRRDFIEKGNHTSILTFHFKSFLPHFFFYRLIVALLGIWRPSGDELLMKNAAIFDAGKENEYHYAAVAVNKTSIQIQVYTRTTTIPLKVGMITEIRKQIEKKMHEITSTFHKKAHYEVGFHCSCKSVKITDEDEECFISEEKLIRAKFKEIPCPKHHEDGTVINKKSILSYWRGKKYTDGQNSPLSPELTHEEEKENFSRYYSLKILGVQALRIFFDEIVPPSELGVVITQNQSLMKCGPYRFNDKQLQKIFPSSGTKDAASENFDETIMYKILRNFTNVQPPTSGWGKDPNDEDITKTDDVERLRKHRNSLAHQTNNTMDSHVFRVKWLDLSQAILRLSDGTLQQEIDQILS